MNEHDLVAEWSADLRELLVAELPAAQVSEMASAASVALTTAIATGAASGGTTMLTLFTKLVAAGSIVAAIGGGTAAVTGNLPDTLQNMSATAAAHIGIDLPRAATVLSIGDAGRISLRLTDGMVTLVDLQPALGWSASVQAEHSDALVVNFRSSEGVKQLTASIGANGDLVTSIRSISEAPADAESAGSTQTEPSQADVDLGADIEVGVGLGGEVSDAEVGADGSVEGDVSVEIDNILP